MKKSILSFTFLLLVSQANAQPWMAQNNKSPLKLSDVVNNYKSNVAPFFTYEEEVKESNNSFFDTHIKEDKNYHFDRWLWYWQQHLDKNGFMVSPVKTLKEWEIYQEKRNNESKLSRKTSIDQSNWIFQGPDSTDVNSWQSGGGVGRINVVSFHPTDKNTFWIGSPGGGAWKTTDDGNTWKCMTDKLPVTAVSDIVFNPQNPNTVYLCTGDRDGEDYYSLGVMKSIDGGNTWSIAGLNWIASDFREANSLVVNPLDTNCLILAASDSIYKSMDGGTTWIGVTSGYFRQVLYCPGDTSILYAAKDYEYFTGSNAEVYRSGDGGNTWVPAADIVNSSRITLAVTPANPAVVKVLADSLSSGFGGFYTSSDTGKTFKKIFSDSSCTKNILAWSYDGTGCGGQGWYDLPLTMSLTDSNLVVAGGVNTWYSTDGGYSWNLLDQWYGMTPSIAITHADKHYLKFDPLMPNRLFECNDGGIFRTDTIGSLFWMPVGNGLGIAEFYRNAVSNNASFVLGGCQDDGSKTIQDGQYIDFGGGDGMEPLIDYADSTTIYGSSQYGGIFKVTNFYNNLAAFGSATYSGISSNIPGMPSGAWVTPYTLHPAFHNYIIAGYQQVFLSRDQGNTWDSISAFTSGDLINSIGMTVADTGTIYALQGTYPTVINITHDMGATWTSITPSGPLVSLTDVLVDPKDKDHFWITYGNYDTSRVAEYIPSTGTWIFWNNNLPDVPVNCIIMDTSNRNLYIGTDVGVFYKTDSMTQWEPYNKNLPAVRVNDLHINYTTNEIWAATYGRSMWKSPKQYDSTDTSHHISGISIIPFVVNSLSVYPNPNKGQFTLSVSKDYANKAATIRVIDDAGKVVWQSELVLNNDGAAVINATLPKGNYIVEVTTMQSAIGRKEIVIL